MTFEVVRELAKQKQYDEALQVTGHWLNKHPNDPAMLYMAGRMMMEKGWPGMAKALCMASAAVSPKAFESWNLLGKAHADVWELGESFDCFRKALQYASNTEPSPLTNMGLAELNRGKPHKAIALTRKALRLDPEDFNARNNLGMALLSIQQWAEGWKLYEYGLGQHPSRKELVYGDEERWDGTKGQTVVAYGEQGLGDEVSFASTIPFLIRDSRKVVIDCDSRLEGLFKRSFPEADVYGTRFRVGDSWVEKYKFDGRVAFSSIQGFYRNKDSDFTGKPYLVADPERRKQWRALLDDLPGLKVGIAWTGGTTLNGKQLRSLALEDLLPVLRQPGCSFISLEYRDPTEEIRALREKHGIDIREWGRATRTQDADDLASLVAELDLVISVTTAVIHFAGGLGKECWVLTHKNPMWRYGYEGDSMPWYASVKLFRQKTDWTYPINQIAEELSKRRS